MNVLYLIDLSEMRFFPFITNLQEVRYKETFFQNDRLVYIECSLNERLVFLYDRYI